MGDMWRVDLISNVYGDEIRISTSSGYIVMGRITQPNFIEKIMGVTLESKTEKLISSANKKCDKLNREHNCASKVFNKHVEKK